MKRLSSFAVCVAFVLPLEAHASDDDLRRVATAWAQRRASLSGIRLRVEGMAVVPKGTLTADPELRIAGEVPPTDYLSPERRLFVLDIAGFRSRIGSEREGFSFAKGEFASEYSQAVSDGKRQRWLRPRDKNPVQRRDPDLVVDDSVPTPTAELLLEAVDYPMYYACGYVPTATRPLTRDLRSTPVEIPGLEKITTRDVQGHRAVVLHTGWKGARGDITEELTCDLGRQGAILRYQISQSAMPLLVTDISLQSIQGYWIPKSWTTTHYGSHKGQSRVIKSYQMAIVQCEMNPSFTSEEFEIPMNAGQLIRYEDSTQLYRIAPDGKTLVPVQDANDPASGGWKTIALFAVSFGVALAGVAVFVLARRRHVRPAVQ